MSIKKAIEKGNACLEERENIPSAPLWHMGKVALLESKESFNLLQNTIDYLTCKAKSSKGFTKNEKEFMTEIFEALWWGGQYHGFKEAAVLASHYVNGGGKDISINKEVYTSSVIVRDTISALKSYIKEISLTSKPLTGIKSTTAEFLRSQFSQPLKAGRRSVTNQGYILNNGVLLAEQSNLRLKNADHRFVLTVNTTKNGSQYLSRWNVESIYDFEPFEKKDYVTDIPLGDNFTLKLPDGLSHYLTKIGVAKDFIYGATWQETWN